MPSLELPSNPNFSSGPCAKRPGWKISVLNKALVGRSHRSKESVKKIQKILYELRSILVIPKDYEVALVGGSDTGAFEMAMWNLLGYKPVEVLAWESFGKDWILDIVEQLKILGYKSGIDNNKVAIASKMLEGIIDPAYFHGKLYKMYNE